MTSVEQFQDGGSLGNMQQGGQRSVICFLGSEGVNPSETHRRMKMQHGDACLSLKHVFDWGRKFKRLASSVRDATLLVPASHSQHTSKGCRS